MMLSQYIRDTARLLRDRSHVLIPEDELTDYINQARSDVCRQTACLRALIVGNAPWGTGATPGLMMPGAMIPGTTDTTIQTFQTLQGVEKYSFDYARPFLKAQFQGFDRVVDIIDVSVSWGSNARPTMEWYAFEELQALGRIYSAGVFTYPFAAATQGDGANASLFLFPVPGQPLEMEWDASCIPTPLWTDNDYDAIPAPFAEAVKYRAARDAFLSSQRFGSADLMHNLYMQHIDVDRAATDRGKVPSYYQG